MGGVGWILGESAYVGFESLDVVGRMKGLLDAVGLAVPTLRTDDAVRSESEVEREEPLEGVLVAKVVALRETGVSGVEEGGAKGRFEEGERTMR